MPCPCSRMQNQLHHHPLLFLSLSRSSRTAPQSQFSFCNTHAAQAQQQDFGQTAERGRTLGQSGSRHRHSIAFSSHPPRSDPACPQVSHHHQVMGRHHRSQRASAVCPQILLPDPKLLVTVQMETIGHSPRPRSSWLHRATSAQFLHRHPYSAATTPPPLLPQGNQP